MMKKNLFLKCQRDHEPGAITRSVADGGTDICHQNDLAMTDLQPYGAILVSMLADQTGLAEQSAKLESFLNRGGILVFNGHVAIPPISGLRPFVGQKGKGVEALKVTRLAPHAVFEGVAEEDLTFRRGVAGFYGRGHNPMPEGAIALNGLGPDKAPLDWIWARPEGGLVFMHCGLDLWAFANDATTAARMAPQLLSWLGKETAEGMGHA